MSRPNQSHDPLRLLSGYAAGAIGPAAACAVAIHVEGCSICGRRLAGLDAIGGALLEQEVCDDPIGFTVEDVLARLESPAPRTPDYPAEVMAVPESLREPFARALRTQRWAFAGPGLRSLDLDIPGADAFGEAPQMLKIEPGYGAPRHGHGGVELTLVLHGAFADETGVYRTGDLAVATPALTHRPVAQGVDTCLTYAVSHAPMQLTGVLGFAQRLLTPRRQ